MTVVTSAQNAHLKLVRRLARRRSRDADGLFVVEGEDLVLAGLECDAEAQVLLVDAQRVGTEFDPARVPCPVVLVEPELLAAVSELAHPPRVMGVFVLPQARDLAVELGRGDAASGPWLALDGVGDPGNVGTVLRSAAALGAGGVALLPGCADPFGHKAVRASMGAVFRVGLARLGASAGTPADELDAVRAAVPGLRVVALGADGDVPLSQVDVDGATLLVVGAERDGVSAEVLSRADVVASIPQDAAVESVNAGVAASIALYEWRSRHGRDA